MGTRRQAESSNFGTRDLRRMKINPDEANQIALRKMCNYLPVPIVPSYASGKNTKRWLNTDQIRFLIQRQLSEEKVKTVTSIAWRGPRIQTS